MTSHLDNHPVVEHHNHIRVLNGGKSMGDANGRPSLHQFVKGGLDDALGFIVQ